MKSIIQKSAVMAVALLSFLTVSAYDFEANGLYYNIISTEMFTCEVTHGDNPYSGDVTIPSSVTFSGKNFTVMAICNSAFEGCTSLTSINLPSSLIGIGNSAFWGCTGLTSIDLPNSLTVIAGSAFRGCTGLTSIDLPNSLNTIYEYAFLGCTGLTSIDFPSSLTFIGNSAFEGCSGLTSINLPSSLIGIGIRMFAECSNLTTAVIFSDISGGCFYDDVSLESLTVMAGKSIDLNYYSSDLYDTFKNVRLKELKINPGDTPDMELHTSDLDSWTRDLQRLYMGGHVRDSQDRRLRFTIPNIQQIFIDESITDISDDFDNLSTCTNLSYIQCNGLTPPETGSIFSESQYAKVQLVVPDNALDSYKNHPIWGNFWNITDISGLPNTHENATSKVEIGRYDIHSRPVSKEFHGFVIVRYSDGSTQKILQ